MAPNSSSSSSSKSPPSSAQPSQFTPIQECEKEELEQEEEEPIPINKTPLKQHHNPTPLHRKGHRSSSSSSSVAAADDSASVSCNKCRPSAREKISIVPLDNNNGGNSNSNSNSNRNSILSAASPNAIFKSILSSLARRRSPKPAANSEDETSNRQWKSAAAELSQKLVQAARKRDDALMEASRLRRSTADLEIKLDRLERYCNSLRSGLDRFSESATAATEIDGEIDVDDFLSAVSESRSAVRVLARSMVGQLRHMGSKVYERLSILLRPYDAAAKTTPRGALILYVEAILGSALFEDFESPGFQRGGARRPLDPAARREACRVSFLSLQSLAWEEVLSRGTRHFSEEFSGFCDRKMSDIVAMLGWNRAWPEPLLQAFFAAAKATWLVHLLANSARPTIDLFRVEPGSPFDSSYMDDVASAPDKTRRLVPSAVRVMVAPGFYVGKSVVKCKVLCRYNNNYSNNVNDDTLISPSSSLPT